MRSISCLVLPIRDHAFFEQTVFEGQFGHNLLQGAGLAAQILHLVRGIASQPLLAGFEKVLRPVSTAETKCAKWRRDNVPVGLREKGFEAPVYFRVSVPIYFVVVRSPTFGVF